MKAAFVKYRKRYTVIVIIGLTITFLLLILQTIGRIYAPSTYIAWIWFLINSLPVSLTLAYCYKEKFRDLVGNKGLSIATVFLLVLYFAGIFTSIFLQPYMQKQEPPLLPLDLLLNSLSLLIPFQLVVISIIVMQLRNSKAVQSDAKLLEKQEVDKTRLHETLSEKPNKEISLEEQRISILKERIIRNETLLAEWEKKLTLTDNPNEKWICNEEIEKFKTKIKEDMDVLESFAGKS